jgi:hypothetical protein
VEVRLALPMDIPSGLQPPLPPATSTAITTSIW